VIDLKWLYNQEACVWEGSNAGWHATVEPNLDMVIYTASIQPEDKSAPIEFAPQAFESLEEAQTWCEQAVYEHAHADQNITSNRGI
jgi:hypothetical protein